MEINKSVQEPNLAKDKEIPVLEEIEKPNGKIMEVLTKASKKNTAKSKSR